VKTIKQIADEIGTTKQAVQKRISREPLCTSIQPYIWTENGTKYIDETGEDLIKQVYEKTVPTDKTMDKSIDNNHGEDNILYQILKAELEAKNEQLAEKDRQIERLTDTVKAQAQSINADRHNELAGTLQMQLMDGEAIKPISRWKRAWMAWKGE